MCNGHEQLNFIFKKFTFIFYIKKYFYRITTGFNLKPTFSLKLLWDHSLTNSAIGDRMHFFHPVKKNFKSRNLRRKIIINDIKSVFRAFCVVYIQKSNPSTFSWNIFSNNFCIWRMLFAILKIQHKKN